MPLDVVMIAGPWGQLERDAKSFEHAAMLLNIRAEKALVATRQEHDRLAADVAQLAAQAEALKAHVRAG